MFPYYVAKLSCIHNRFRSICYNRINLFRVYKTGFTTVRRKINELHFCSPAISERIYSVFPIK